MVCTRCGAHNTEGATACVACGAVLAPVEAAGPAWGQPSPPPAWQEPATPSSTPPPPAWQQSPQPQAPAWQEAPPPQAPAWPQPPVQGPPAQGPPAAPWGQAPPPQQPWAPPSQPGWGAQPPGYPPQGAFGGGFPGGPGPQGGQLATWGTRAKAYLLDALIFVVPTLVLSVLARFSVVFATLSGLWDLVAIALGVWLAVQVGTVGASPGMRVVGLRCISARTGQPPGGGTGFLRSLYHTLLSLACGIPAIIDLLFPLWDTRRQTLADKMAGTYVVTADPQPFSIAPAGTFSWGPFWLTGNPSGR